MSTAYQAIKSARAYLNDINGINWTDALLMPLLQEAHGELVQELELNNIGVLKYQTAPITILAGALTMGANQPVGLVNPVSMMEREPGGTADDFEDMQKVTFIPEEDQDNYLTYWAWMRETITFLGATANREVILRYEGTIAAPNTLNDNLGCLFAERFIGPRVAALAYASAGKDNKFLLALAAEAKYKLIQSLVVNDQRPTRHKGYRSPKGCYGPVSTPVYRP